jgi:hypothetical protein
MFTLHTGMNVRASAELFNEEAFEELELHMVNNLYHANLKSNKRNRWLNIVLIIVAALLLLGIINLIVW